MKATVLAPIRSVRSIRPKGLSTLAILLVLHGMIFAQNSPVNFGNSYVNVSKKTVGGPVQPGDTLEIRTTFSISGTYNGNGQIYKIRYYDNLPTHTAVLAGDPFLRLVSNEGLTIRQYTQNPADADAGAFVLTPALPGDYQVRINMGGPPFSSSNPTAPGGADPMGLTDTVGARDMKGNSNFPKFGGSTLISTSFRVKVTGAYGDTITLGAGKIVYRTSAAALTDTAINANQYKILIAKPVTLCSSTVGTNFAAESGGTFGHGVGRNRSTGPTFLIPNYTYLPNSGTSPVIGDGYYAIVNNISPTSSTFANARRVPNCNVAPTVPASSPNSCANREFTGYWFISGDHTGTSTAAGNTPPDSLTDAGYMLLVNADLATSEAYRQTISGLCPNTYYQFSAWIKNVCPTCGIDTSGNATYLPGVLPNLTFVVDGLDRFSSGQLDTIGWQKRGFVLLTGASQTSITISLRNNAPGGGGNDWAMDDITLANCPPDLLLTPNKPDTLCQGADDTVRFKIASFVDNYTQWMLQKSTDGGATWISAGTDTTGKPAADSVVPVFDPVSGEYIDTVVRYFRVPAATAQIIYRITVASTVANLSSSGCSFTTMTPKIVKAVNCNIILPTTLIFKGQNTDGFGNLQWVSSNEVAEISYTVERSDDGANFTPVGVLDGIAPYGEGASYHFTDPNPLAARTYYRINLGTPNYHQYSNQVLLGNQAIAFAVHSLANPFTDHIPLELTAPTAGVALVTLVDIYGRVITQVKQTLEQGLNNLTLYGLGALANGAYALQVRYNGQLISTKMLKLSN
jgi:hypothetical protein